MECKTCRSSSFVVPVLEKGLEVREKKYVEFLTYLNVIVETTENAKLLLIDISGISNFEQPGVPLLIPKVNDMEQNTDGILEFDFVISTSSEAKCQRLEWDLKVVFNLDELPKNIAGIKVKANSNADLVLLSMVN